MGAGISGMALALLLQRQGYKIQLVEKRNYQADDLECGRSINFTLTHRGLDVLKKLNLSDKILAQAAVLKGRMVHSNGHTHVYHYSSKQEQALYSIRRKKLIDILFDEIKQCPDIELILDYELMNIDQTTWACEFLKIDRQQRLSLTADIIIGADGAFSKTRQLMLNTHAVSYQQKFFDWKYKELFLTATEAENLQISAHHLHVWPRANNLLVAIPNADGSFGLLFSARDAKNSHIEENINLQFMQSYPDLIAKAPSLTTLLTQAPVSYLVSISIDQWVYDNKIVLIGDACHAVFPFYGQGMNCALEDAVYLAEQLKKQTTEKALQTFEHNRKPSADALNYLSEMHFYRLQQSYTSLRLEARNKLDCWLAKRFPKHWRYEYEMVAHTHMPYQKVVQIVKRQHYLRNLLGLPLLELMIASFIAFKKLNQSLKQGKKPRLSSANVSSHKTRSQLALKA